MPRISELPAASVVNDADVVVIVQDGVTKKAAKSLLGGGDEFTTPTGSGPVTVTGGVLDAAAGTTTGTGAYARATSPTFVTPVLGAATGTSVALSSFCSTGAAPAAAGQVRLSSNASTGGVFVRKANGLADINLISEDTSGAIRVGDGTHADSVSVRAATVVNTVIGATTVASFTSSSVSLQQTSYSATGNARYQPFADIANVQTTDATVTTLFSFTPTDEAVTLFTVEALAVLSTGAETNSYIRRVRIKRDGGTVTLGSVVDVSTDEETAAWDCTIDLSGTTVRVRVTGENAHTIDWGCTATRQVLTHA